MGKTSKKKSKISSELKFFIFIVVMLVAFIFGLKPLYKLMDKIKTGTLFEKSPTYLTPDKEGEQEKQDDYQILKPSGASYIVCKNRVISETDEIKNGERESSITLYYTSEKLRSIVEKHVYVGSNDTYSNYIMSEQNKYKEIKNLNLDNNGISVEVELNSPNDLTVRAVYLLERTTLNKIKTPGAETLNLYGNYDDSIYEVLKLYRNEGYICNW